MARRVVDVNQVMVSVNWGELPCDVVIFGSYIVPRCEIRSRQSIKARLQVQWRLLAGCCNVSME